MTTPRQAVGGPFKALLWSSGFAQVETQRYDDPVDALAACMAALQNGYQARLSDNAVAWFRAHEAVGGLKLSDHLGGRRAAPSQVAEVPAERLPAERAAEAPEPAKKRRGKAAVQSPAEVPPEPVAPAVAPRRGRRAVAVKFEPAAEPEAEAPRRRGARRSVPAEAEPAPVRRGRGRPPAVPEAQFRAPAEAVRA